MCYEAIVDLPIRLNGYSKCIFGNWFKSSLGAQPTNILNE